MILRNFAVLEGCDGSGTTTQMDLLKKRFGLRETAEKSAFPPLFCTAEPTEGPVGSLIRHILRGEDTVSGETLARLFAADRGEHLYCPKGIVERCCRGELVVSDRYTPSSLVYQAVDCGAELPESLNESFPFPELLVYLDIDSETAEKRISTRPEREIFEYMDFQKKVREGYFKLLPVWEKAGVRTLILDASKKQEEVAEEVWRAVAEMPIMKRK